jgi:hypothetical protein
MKNIDKMTEKILKGIEEETTGASISYLPGSFASTRSVIDDLSRIKKKWNIKVLERDNTYVVMFEDVLSIEIPREHYEDFNKNVVAIEGVSVLDLSNNINESIKEVQGEVYSRLYQALVSELKQNKHIQSSSILMKHWMHTFPNSRFIAPEETVAIKLNDFENDAKRVAQEIENLHGDDLGEADAIVDAIEEGRPIGGFEKYDFIAGIKIKSSYEGVNLIAEFNVNSAMVCSQAVYIDNVDVLDELEAYRDIKVLYRRVFPIGHEFQPSVFGNIKDVIEEVA